MAAAAPYLRVALPHVPLPTEQQWKSMINRTDSDCNVPASECCGMDNTQPRSKSSTIAEMLLAADAAFGRLASSIMSRSRARGPSQQQPPAKHQRRASQHPSHEQLKSAVTEPAQPAAHHHAAAPASHSASLLHKKQSVSPHTLALPHKPAAAPSACAEPLQQQEPAEGAPCASEATLLLQQKNDALQNLLARQERELLEQQLLIKEASEKLVALKYYKTQFRAAQGRAEGFQQKRASLEKQHKKELAASRHSTHLAVLKVLDLEKRLQQMEQAQRRQPMREEAAAGHVPESSRQQLTEAEGDVRGVDI